MCFRHSPAPRLCWQAWQSGKIFGKPVVIHFENLALLGQIWPLGVMGILAAILVLRSRSQQAARVRQKRASRHLRNVAHYRAWNWIMGRPRSARLTDQRHSKRPPQA